MESNGLRAGIEKIEEMAFLECEPMKVNGVDYAATKLYQIRPEIDTPDTIALYTLSSLATIIKKEALEQGATLPLFVRIASAENVAVFSSYDPQSQCKRDYLYSAKAKLPSVRLNTYMPHEEFMIAIRSKFVQNDDAEYLIKLLSKITDANSVSTEDNGVSQTVEVKKGIALVENEIVRSCVTLAPYRTFLEVKQPESEFLLRLKEGGQIGLFEADGGAWELDAIKNIYYELRYNLTVEVEAGNVCILE